MHSLSHIMQYYAIVFKLMLGSNCLGIAFMGSMQILPRTYYYVIVYILYYIYYALNNYIIYKFIYVKSTRSA